MNRRVALPVVAMLMLFGFLAPAPALGQGQTDWTIHRLKTSEGRFVPGVDNQGSLIDIGGGESSPPGYGRQGDYSVYVNDANWFGEDRRNYFSFDLAAIEPGSVRRATLVLQRYDTVKADVQYSIHQVTTDARALNTQTADPAAVYRDIADGPLLGSYDITDAADPASVIRLRLNKDAVAAINEAAGGYFSLGGTLASLDFDAESFRALFSGSSSAGKQRLVLKAAPASQ